MCEYEYFLIICLYSHNFINYHLCLIFMKLTNMYDKKMGLINDRATYILYN